MYKKILKILKRKRIQRMQKKRISNFKKRILKAEKHKEKTKEYIKADRKKKQLKKDADNLSLKNMNNQASAELSKRKRLNNMSYRDWNKSAFDYNEKRKGFEFKKELGRSYDVPKFIKVEV